MFAALQSVLLGKNRTKSAMLVATLVLGGGASTAKAQAYSVQQRPMQTISQWLVSLPQTGGEQYDRNRDGWVDLVKFDVNRDGWIDVVLIDTNYDRILEIAVMDTNYNGKFDTWFVASRLGLFDFRFIDMNEDGRLDVGGRDVAGDGTYSMQVPLNAAPAGTGDLILGGGAYGHTDPGYSGYGSFNIGGHGH